MPDRALGPLRVLFVDDNPDDRMLAQVAIRRDYPGLVPIEATDAASFAAALEGGDFDLAITDFNLRWSDGLTVLRATKEAWPDRPVVMYTGSGSEEIAVAAMRAGLDDYVLKGGQRALRLSAAVRSALTRVQQRRALEASQTRYRELFEGVPVGLFRAAGDGLITDANVALAETLGLADRGSLVGRPWRSVWVDPTEWDRWQTSIARDGVTEGFEALVRRPDGELRSVIVHARAGIGGDGPNSPVEGSVVDVTDRRIAADALRASEARKGAMLEASLDAVIAIDEAGRITEFSPAAERTFGHRMEDVLGRELADLIVPVDLQDRHRAGIARYVATGESTILGHRVELRAMTASGDEIPVEIAVNRIDVPGPPAFIAYVRDISEQRRLEELARQRQRIEAIGQLAGGIAHDFNNMLTVIGGFSALLLDELAAADPRRGLVDGIEQATARAKALTRQLLAFSRRQVLRPEPVDLGHLVNEMLPLFRRVVPEDIETKVNVARAGIVAEIDPAQLEQVLLNLVVNARDAMLTGGTLSIETGTVDLDEAYASSRPGVAPGRYAMIAVSDTGSGMSPEVQARIFEPFFTTKEVGKGSGLGLAMAYGTIKQSGGDMWVYSEEGHGTTFRIYLPLTESPPAAREAALAVAGPSLPPGTTVLVVEDEDQVRTLMVRALIGAGCTVFTASNGMEALSTVDPGLPLDIVITDVIMPGHNGPEVVSHIRETRPDVKVLFISGYAPQFAMNRGLAMEPDAHFLQKPFTLNQLIAAVGDALEGGVPTR